MSAVRKQSAKVLELFKAATKTQWDDTPKRKLARERNWCYYMLAGMGSLAGFMKRRGWISEAPYTSLIRAINAARYSVDAQWYDKLEELEERDARRSRRRS